MENEVFDYCIAGLGAAGLHLAMVMSEDAFFDNKKILLIDQDPKTTNDRTWCFWENGKGKWDDILLANWSDIDFVSENVHKAIPLENYRYKMLKGLDFYQYTLNHLKNKRQFVIKYDSIARITEKKEHVEIETKNQIFNTLQVFSSILDYSPDCKGFPTLSQHFGGWFIRTENPVFYQSSPQFMNFDIPQNGKTCFMYVLPYKENEALFEYTFFSKEIMSHDQYDSFLEDYLKNQNIGNYSILEKEYGQIPMTSYPFWKKNSHRKIYIGSAGGYTKPSTGYTFYFCQKYADVLVNQIKNNKNLSHFSVFNRYYWYDNILLDVLEKNNHLGKEIFTNMFEKNSINTIFRFLNNESSIIEDFFIIAKTKYPLTFFTSLLRTL